MRIGAVLLMVPSLSLGLACNVLAIEPGQAPSVKITWPLQVVNGADSGTTDVHFQVENCPTFTAQVEHRAHESLQLPGYASALYRVETQWEGVDIQPEAEGLPRSYVAHLPRKALVRDTGLACHSDDANPILGELRMKVTCGKATLTAVSDPIPVHFTAAPQTTLAFSSEQLKPLAEPGHFISFRRDGLDVWHPEAQTRFSHLGHLAQSGDWARDDLQINASTFAARGSQGYAGGRCPLLDCGTFTLPGGRAVGVSYVYELDLAKQPEEPSLSHSVVHQVAVGAVQVPGDVQFISVDRDGSALVFSTTISAEQPRSPMTIVTRVRGDQVTVEKLFQDRALYAISTEPREDGDVALLLWHIEDWQVFTIERQTLQGGTDSQAIVALAAQGGLASHPPKVWLSPDGDQWLVDNHGVAYLGGVGAPATGLTQGNVVVVWNTDSLLLIRSDRTMAAFARGGNHEQLFAMPGHWGADAAPLPNGGYAITSMESARDDRVLRFIDAHGNTLGESALAPCGEASPDTIAVLSDGYVATNLEATEGDTAWPGSHIHKFAIPDALTAAVSSVQP